MSQNTRGAFPSLLSLWRVSPEIAAAKKVSNETIFSEMHADIVKLTEGVVDRQLSFILDGTLMSILAPGGGELTSFSEEKFGRLLERFSSAKEMFDKDFRQIVQTRNSNKQEGQHKEDNWDRTREFFQKFELLIRQAKYYSQFVKTSSADSKSESASKDDASRVVKYFAGGCTI